MCEQVKSIDYRARKVKYVEKASDNLLSHCLGIIESIF